MLMSWPEREKIAVDQLDCTLRDPNRMIRYFLGLPDPDPCSLVSGTYPYQNVTDLDHSLIEIIFSFFFVNHFGTAGSGFRI